MSALDDCIENTTSDIPRADRELARAELELLRQLAFAQVGFQLQCGGVKTYILDILRTDPERAKRMGLGWAL